MTARVTLRPDRRFWAVLVICGWLGGMAALAARRHSVPPAQLLARGVLGLQPATFYYAVTQNGRPIGSASSAIDTLDSGLLARDVAIVRGLNMGDSQTVTGISSAYLSRAFALDSFALSVNNGRTAIRLHGKTVGRDAVLLPGLVPIAVMLATQPRVGTRTAMWIYNPVARRVQRVTLSIAAESLFRVVDSAAFDSPRGTWIASHADTIRSWKITIPTNSVSAWVDSQGRIVEAEEAGGLKIVRTAYEVAALNQKQFAH
ncbi:MAG: hypothetical protein M3R65_10935 [Gemmatimonadota bacterium]|nr:hypothetical protein [Gemmatimonadota bacterium]